MHRLAVNLAVRKFSRGAAKERLAKYTSTTFAIRFIAIVGVLALCTSATVWQSPQALELVASRPAISTVSNSPSCKQVTSSTDQCAFVRKHCQDEEDGRIPYLQLLYCSLGAPAAAAWYILIIGWAMYLFLAISISAGDFFAVNLSSLARTLRMSDTLAGVTLLALGNGGPDIFSTWAAMTSDSPGLAFGELIGAASFITTVVVGSIACTGSFQVRKASLARDAFFLLVTACFLLVPLLSGEFRLWHGLVMISGYLVYIAWVTGYHRWVSSKQDDDQTADDETQAGDEEQGQLTATETRPLLSNQQTQLHKHQDHQRHHIDPAISRQIHDWRRAHGRCIEARDESFMTSPSLPGAMEYSWRRGQEHKRASTSHNETSTLHSQHPPHSRTETSDNRVLHTLFPSLQSVREKNLGHAIVSMLTVVPYLILKLTVPVVDNEHNADCQHGWHRGLLILQGITAPQLIWLMLWLDMDHPTMRSWLLPAIYCAIGSAVFCLGVFTFSSPSRRPRWMPLLSVLGFAVSAFWLSVLPDELVAILKAFGIVLRLSDAILGFTVFAIGNCVDDYVVDMTITRHGHPVMALAACFGGPLLNILLGLGISIVYVILRAGHRIGHIRPITLEVDTILIVTTAVLAATMVGLVLTLRLNHWEMNKRIGLSLIFTWVALTGANVGIELLT
ncbi:hypothetical protein LTR53_000718 [Teratosphaeriaceae sp. CCFEE 6253]|nr:hypothetical protein LTR53_000718 [Teratosphaeriaceae sp. CCFEE 6253]